MIRWIFFFALAAALTAYSFWIYSRVELAIEGALRLAVVRAATLVVVLLLLFDPRVPAADGGAGPTRWVLLDASLSMEALGSDGVSAWEEALARATALEADGWRLAPFGEAAPRSDARAAAGPDQLHSLLAPALAQAAEAGAREVTVLSDFRFEDAVAVQAAMESLPLDVTFEGFGGPVRNAGVGRFVVPDLLQAEGQPVAEVEVHGGDETDSIFVEIAEEGRAVASVWVAAPSPGLRRSVRIELPTPAASGRVRYTAHVSIPSDAFSSDDDAVSYANVGHAAGALVLVSVRPDWEPRHLLPVLEEVTGLPAIGYLRAGADRFVTVGRAIDRGPPVDSATVRRAVADAAVLVVHGVGVDVDPWMETLLTRPGRRLVLPRDAAGAALVGLDVGAPQPGEWYVSPDIPTSPIAGALGGVALQGLPPLTDVMVPTVAARQPPLHVQLRGAGSPESAFHLMERPAGRIAVALASGFWRWAMRDGGREPYRRVWSGVVGWLLADETLAAAEPRPVSWVVDRRTPVEWSVPNDTFPSRISVHRGDSLVIDTLVSGGGPVSTGILPSGEYRFDVVAESGDTLSTGRFDVSGSTSELLPARVQPEVPIRSASVGIGDEGLGTPLRTLPWPYLLIIVLLCAEWVVRRRSGLR